VNKDKKKGTAKPLLFHVATDNAGVLLQPRFLLLVLLVVTCSVDQGVDCQQELQFFAYIINRIDFAQATTRD
jgi:hypothetical protein